MNSRELMILPKTDFSFNGAASTTQEVQLLKYIRSVPFVSGVLEVRVYARNMNSGQEITLALQPTSPAPDDPAAQFVITAGEITARVVSATTPPTILFQPLTAPLPSHYRLIVRAVQNAGGGVFTATVSASLVLRDA